MRCRKAIEKKRLEHGLSEIVGIAKKERNRLRQREKKYCETNILKEREKDVDKKERLTKRERKRRR